MILMTEEEYAEFQDSGGDVSLLKKFMDIGKDDIIEDWEKGSTVYAASDDEDVETGIEGRDANLPWDCGILRFFAPKYRLLRFL